MKTKFREEHDSIGKIKVPQKKYWGAQTQRSLKNFKIGNDLMPIEIVYSFALQKKAAAISNIALKKLEINLGEKIIETCDEILSGKHDDHFPLKVWQTGSGTQTNMNVNEVIANRSNELFGEKLVNIVPFTLTIIVIWSIFNDSFPTVIHLTIIDITNKKLIPCLKKFIKNIRRKKRI